MILHPDVRRKAQAKLDGLTNGDRLPSFTDKEQLPYLDALVTEVFRWHTLAPLGTTSISSIAAEELITEEGVVHQSSEDDVYEGYFILKGSVIFPNIWQVFSCCVLNFLNLSQRQMAHDPKVHQDPDTFNPK